MQKPFLYTQFWFLGESEPDLFEISLNKLSFKKILPNQFFSAVTANVANISCNYLLSKPRLQLYSVWNMFVFQSKWFKSICLLGWRLITNFVISPNATITDGKASLKSLTRFEIRSLWQEGKTLTYMPQSFFSQMCIRQIDNIRRGPMFTSFKTDLYQEINGA